MWELRFYKFKHDVNHHAKEEEQKLFPEVKAVLTQDDLRSLGEKMQKFKASLMKWTERENLSGSTSDSFPSGV